MMMSSVMSASDVTDDVICERPLTAVTSSDVIDDVIAAVRRDVTIRHCSRSGVRPTCLRHGFAVTRHRGG